MFPKPGQTQPLRKVVAVAKFAPWNIVVYAGAYTDDLEAAFRASLLRMVGIGGAILVVTALIAWFVGRDITHSLGRPEGRHGAPGRGQTRRRQFPAPPAADEVGEMAAAVLVFQQHMVTGRATGRGA